MKTSFFTISALCAAASFVIVTPAFGKKEKKRQAAETVEAVVPELVPDLSNPWHTWTASSGEKLQAQFKALENGIVTVEQKDKKTLRFPLSRLSAEDQKFAHASQRIQAHPAMSREVIGKAAAKIDALVFAGLSQNKLAPNPATTDAQWVRRIHLDTIGRIPTADEATTFLANPSSAKRAELIEQLLNSPGYTMHMYNWLADMLRVKDDYGKGAKAYLYEDWLKGVIAMNAPWDVMVRAMLTADGKLNENGAAGFILRDAQMPLDGVSNLLTTFLGANVSCAQCHDHPFADWSQRDFYSMAAFFGATDGFREDVYRKVRSLSKMAEAQDIKKGLVNGLLISNAYDLVDLPTSRLKFPTDYQYKDAKPGDLAKPELIRWEDTSQDNPAYPSHFGKPAQLRNEFAEWMVHPENPRFAMAIANRIWKKVFGIAVQEPVSDIDDPSAASHPELLQLLTTYMKQAKFDLREFQRIIFNTAAYQRQASEFPEDFSKYHFQGPTLRRMSAEQAWDSIVTLVSGKEVDAILLRRGDNLQKTMVAAGEMNLESVIRMIAEMKSSGLKIKGGKKGNPTALANSYEGGRPVMRSGMILARASELPQPAPENHFLRLFGQSDRLVSDTNTTDGSVPQMLQLMNGPVQEVITRNSLAISDASGKSRPDAQIASLYLSFLGRQPSSAESSKAIAALGSGLQLSDLAWILLNTREFLFIP